MAALALSYAGVRAEQAEIDGKEGCIPCGAYQQPREQRYPSAEPYGCGEEKPSGCLGICECPYGSTKQFGVLDGQASCQDVITVGCGVPNPLDVIGEDILAAINEQLRYTKSANADPTGNIEAFLAAIFAIPTARQVCVSQSIFVRPYCKVPASPVWLGWNHYDPEYNPKTGVFDPNWNFLGALNDPDFQYQAAFLQLTSIVGRYFSTQIVLEEQPDGSLVFAIRFTRDDCNHFCPEGFYYAEELTIPAFYESCPPLIPIR